MKTRIKNIVTLGLVAVMAVTTFSGCANKTSNEAFDITNAEAITENTMPITNEDVEISIYLDNRSRGALETYADAESMKELQKVTGIKINFEHPIDASSDQLNLMLSSGDVPDVLYLSTYFYGGWANTQLKKAAYNGMFLKLDDYIEKFAPNLSKYLSENPDVNQAYHMTNPDGSVYTIPAINSDPTYNYYDGYFIRKDWLDKLGLSVPNTIDEWETVLRAFVTQDPNGNGEADEVGFSTFNYMTKFVFMPAFDVYNCNYYLDADQNKITHGILNKGFKEYLTTISRWYKDGLINPEYVSTDQKTLDYLVLNDKLGAFYCDNNNSAIKFVEGNPDMELIAVPFVKSPDGERRTAKVSKGRISGYGALISSKTKYPVEIMRLFDYLFTEEGNDIHNWGVKDVSFTINDKGERKFTELITKNPEGKSIVEAYNAFTAAGVNGGFPGIFDTAAQKELNNVLTKKQKALQDVSIQYCDEVDKSWEMPMTPTTLEEDEEINSLSADLNTYISEMYAKFVTGTESLENFDSFVETAKKMGIDRVLEIRQKAYERGLENVKNLK